MPKLRQKTDLIITALSGIKMTYEVFFKDDRENELVADHFITTYLQLSDTELMEKITHEVNGIKKTYEKGIENLWILKND